MRRRGAEIHGFRRNLRLGHEPGDVGTSPDREPCGGCVGILSGRWALVLDGELAPQEGEPRQEQKGGWSHEFLRRGSRSSLCLISVQTLPSSIVRRSCRT